MYGWPDPLSSGKRTTMPRGLTLLFLMSAVGTFRTQAQCILPSQMNVYSTCIGINVSVFLTQGNATPPYEFAIDVNGTQYLGTGTDPTGFNYEVPWNGNTVVQSIGMALHDAANCNAFATWAGTLTRLETPVEYSTDLNCSTGQWTLRWTNADDACGSAGVHSIRAGNYNGQVSNLCTQETSSVWRFNTPLDPPSVQFSLDYSTGLPPVGYQCGGGTVQCWTPINQSIPLTYVQPGDCGVNFQLNATLQGPMGSNGLMSETLRTAGLVPLTEPYSALGYTYTGSPSLSAVPAYWMTTGAWAIVDWVVVELRSAQNPATVVYSRPAFITKNGRVRDKNFYLPTPGSIDENLNFPVAAGNYHIAIRHRNHLGIMTATPIALDDEPELLDLRLATTVVYGTAPRVLAGGYWCLWAADATGNGQLKYTGAGNDRDPILTAIGSTTPNNALTNQYSRLDVNLDGVVKYTGANNDRDPILTNIGSTTPNNTRVQQLP